MIQSRRHRAAPARGWRTLHPVPLPTGVPRAGQHPWPRSASAADPALVGLGWALTGLPVLRSASGLSGSSVALRPSLRSRVCTRWMMSRMRWMKPSRSDLRMNSLWTWGQRGRSAAGMAGRPRPAHPPHAHHDSRDFLWVVPVQVELEGHHLVVVGLQLALHHPVILVGDLQAAELVSPGSAHPPVCPLPTALTLVMRSRDRARRRSSFPEARLGGNSVPRSLAESPS